MDYKPEEGEDNMFYIFQEGKIQKVRITQGSLGVSKFGSHLNLSSDYLSSKSKGNLVYFLSFSSHIFFKQNRKS